MNTSSATQITSDVKGITVHKALLALAVSLIVGFTANAAEVGTFSGRVITPNGTPIKGAVVTLPGFVESNQVGETTTNADGFFTLRLNRSIHRRSSALRIEAEGYAATYVDDRHLTLFSGLDKNLGDIRLDSGRIYSGRVLNSEGEPISL